MDKEMLKDGRILALKIIAESYMISKGKEDTAEIFPRNISSEATITGEENLILHNWLNEEYKKMGLSLEGAVIASGEAYDGKRLSQYEINELVKRADALLLQMGVFKQYIDYKIANK